MDSAEATAAAAAALLERHALRAPPDAQARHCSFVTDVPDRFVGDSLNV